MVIHQPFGLCLVLGDVGINHIFASVEHVRGRLMIQIIFNNKSLEVVQLCVSWYSYELIN